MPPYHAAYLDVGVRVAAFAEDETGINVSASRRLYIQQFQELLVHHLVYHYGYPQSDGFVHLTVTVTYLDDETGPDNDVDRVAYQILRTDADDNERETIEAALDRVYQDIWSADKMTDIIVPDWDTLEKLQWQRLEANVRQALGEDYFSPDQAASPLDVMMGHMAELKLILMSLDRVRNTREQYQSGKKVKHWMLHPWPDDDS